MTGELTTARMAPLRHKSAALLDNLNEIPPQLPGRDAASMLMKLHFTTALPLEKAA